MLATIKHNNRNYKIDLAAPLDISIAMTGKENNINAWYLQPPRIEPHQEDGFVGKVSQGASVNFNDIWFNPHSHVTHTECAGHITEEFQSVNQSLKRFFFLAELVTVALEMYGEDRIVSKKQLQYALGNKKRKAIVIRTLPNLKSKKFAQYSNTNPPYLTKEALVFLREKGIAHLLVDLPSVDRERDEGRLAGHHAFWNTKGALRKQATITEFIYVPNRIKDGTYFLNLQVAPIENDASPSRPVLYSLMD
ncbi:N-formylkynurenine (Aryl-) formamidase [Croceitalea dokdonensis DOKDO 023]|uniref:N-formylkynurenine (Aryl-) formamidase n=1 Tax=Croceitalea dokdonensis DOKDO 023 TaxID=1300341 RepID=A0A0P7ARL7_9FLAO|nr:cyclase family protein [Croceitalea dokdonensis]KPM31176.1 N-formylkynurenine (Aryl-) formamidase [Croceitalea dokdonensis DOKDO 023]